MNIEKIELKIRRFVEERKIYVGMQIADLIEILGQPHEIGGESRKYKMPSIFKYGEVQFVFSPARSKSEIVQQELLYIFIDSCEEDEFDPQFLLQ